MRPWTVERATVLSTVAQDFAAAGLSYRVHILRDF